jgi:nicotinamidase/pyrazinamidase
MAEISYITDIALTPDDALIVVDLQPDFMPGGSLSVAGGDEIITGINTLVPLFHTVAATQDWHPMGHKSFASSHPDKEPYDLFEAPGLGPVLWPDHCVAGTPGANFHPDFVSKEATLILRKGTNSEIDSYSTFRENDMKTETGLSGYLKTREAKRVFLCGLALDYCVYYSALDGVEMGFDIYVIKDLTRAVDSPPGHLEESLATMNDRGVKFVESKTLL